MTDFAELGLKIDSTQVTAGVGELDKLTAAGGRAEAAIDKLGDEAAQTGGQVKGASAAAADYVANVQKMANNTRLTGTHVESLGKASLAARANVNALGSEMGQLAGSLATGNLSAGQAAGSIGRIGVASGITLGAVAALTAGLGLLGAAFLGVKQSAASDAELQKYIQTLGLTRKEIEKLTDATVTWGDISKATFQVLAEAAGTSASQVSGFWTNTWKSIGEFGKFSIGVLLGAFATLVRGTYNAFANVAATVGNAFVAAGNFGITAFEKMVNLAIGGANKVAGVINSVFGTHIAAIAEVSLGRINIQFQRTAEDSSAFFMKTFNDVQAGFDRISSRASEIAKDRLKSQADDIIADRTQKAAKAHRERADAADKEAERLRKLWEARQALLEQPQAISSGLLNADQKPLDTVDLNIANSLTDMVDPAQQLLDTLRGIADQSQVTAQIMSDAFGNVGDVFGGIINGIAEYQVAQQSLAMEVAKGSITQANAEKTLATLRARNVGAAISGIKGLFSEHSKAYKIMSAIEKAYAVWQAAETIASIARDVTKTTSSVANSAVRTTANTAEGGSKIFAELGPWAFPVVAAMVAVIAALGFRGGGGGGGGAPPTSAQDLQDAAGTGTVLGDSKAKSESIANSLELVAQNTNRDLEYSNAMLKALRNIDTSIAKMAGTVARQISVSGSLFDTSNQKLGTNSSGGFLGLFGSTTTRTLYDLGVQFGAMTVGSILENGIDGQSYQVIEKIKKKKGFLGIGSSTKTTYSTTYGTIDPEITAAIQSVIGSLRDALVAGADVIGLQGAQAILDSFSVNLGKISFKDMTGQEIEDQLNAIFSSIGDQMAGKLLPSLKDMQLVGEGLFETFMRVAKEYQAVDIALKSIGRTFGQVGVESIAARDALVQLFGGLDEFLEATDFFRDQFLTEAEQIAPIAASVRDEMARLGVAGITTRDQFKQAVLGLDLTTEAGREMYASLLAVAPAFDKVLDYVEQLNKQQIQTLQSTVDQFTKFAESLKKYRDTLFDTGAMAGNAYATLRQKFLATSELAATGDATALGGLESSAKSFLDAARNNASSREQYLRDVAMVARGVDAGIFAAEETADYAQLQLDALKNAVSILADIGTNTAATVDILQSSAPVTAPAGSVPTAGGTSVNPNAVVEEQNDTIIAQNGQLINLLTEQQKFWRRVEGEGILVRGETDTPLYTTAAP